MATLLYIEASPRADASASTQAAKVYLDSLDDHVIVDRLQLFEASLPEFSSVLAAAKGKIMSGQEMTVQEGKEWEKILALVEQFMSADRFLFSVPMWNLSIPYKLKQYIDLITHPGLTFTSGAEGIKGLATGSACVIYARGGNYSPNNGVPDPYDFQSPYFTAWLAMVGIVQVDEVLVQRTLAGPDAQNTAIESARPQLVELANKVR